jgi:hypothetical protein
MVSVVPSELPPYDAVIVVLVLLDTGGAVTTNDPELAAAGTTMLVGIEPEAMLPDRLTEAPPVGAALDSATVHVLEAPLVMVPGEHEKEEIDIGCTAIGALTEDPPYEAVIMPLKLRVTSSAVAVNVPIDEPAGMLILDGKEMASVFVDKAIIAVLVGAVARLTVHVLEVPPVKVAGVQTSEDVAAGRMPMEVLDDAPPYDAVIVAAALLETAVVETLKAAVVAPAVTVTLAGVLGRTAVAGHGDSRSSRGGCGGERHPACTGISSNNRGWATA